MCKLKQFRANFGSEPYLIMNEPIAIKICRIQKKSSLFKAFDLLIEGHLFSYIVDNPVERYEIMLDPSIINLKKNETLGEK